MQAMRHGGNGDDVGDHGEIGELRRGELEQRCQRVNALRAVINGA